MKIPWEVFWTVIGILAFVVGMVFAVRYVNASDARDFEHEKTQFSTLCHHLGGEALFNTPMDNGVCIVDKKIVDRF